MHKVFVYGTLKRGQRAELSQWGNAAFIGDGETQDKYTMYDGGFPTVSMDTPTGTIKGEVWEIDDEVLRHIDRYEGVGVLFDRFRVKVLIDGEVMECFMYAAHDREYLDGLQVLESGCWR
ncbi:MAG: gamma-glutamylcyclotransferase [Candidatus Hydrogenedentes bacterium]|nr:gamma-glutamylcyclotransferase [Candidatus Hydrogenedentota bacterium]